jgi:endonuclease IV
MRAEAARYQLETGTRARSDAHQLVLHARLTTQKEIEEIIRQASEEIQKVLADIRVIRITAQEELAAQRKFTDAAKLSSLSLSMKEVFHKPAEKKPKKKLVTVKE